MATRFLWSFLGSLVILSLVLLVVDMLLNLDDVLEAHDTFWGAIEFLIMRNASIYLVYLLPVATFTGAFVAVGQAARFREVIAMKAGGVAPLRALLPILGISAVIALTAGVLGETLMRSSSALIGASLDREEAGGGVSVNSGRIWYHTGHLIYNVRETELEQETVEDIRVFERDDEGRLVRWIHAERARRVAPTEWHFERAIVRTFDPVDPNQPPTLETADEITLQLAQDRSPRLTPQELASLSLPTLAGHVGNVLANGGNPGRARSVLHARLTGPLMAILFALLALPLALSVEQTRSLAMPALHGVALLFVFITAREYGANFSTGGALSAALVPWMVFGVFFAYGAWQLVRVPR